MLLVDQLNPDEVYWRAVLRYCAVGGLQPTLDEYLHSPYPLSRDLPRLERLKEDLVFYRLAFGQPRQEDMLALMRRNGVTAKDAVPQILDLRPGTGPPGKNSYTGSIPTPPADVRLKPLRDPRTTSVKARS